MTIPVQAMPIVGRSNEIKTILDMMANPECRLITLTGPGGIGKTSIAIEIARQVDESYFVSLQELNNAEQMVTALAQELCITLNGPEDPLDQLLYALPEQATLVLDNFEHLTEAAPILSTIIQRVPHIRFLVTSRVVLSLQDEWVYKISGLDVPESPDEDTVYESSSITLFAERARKIRQNFEIGEDIESVVCICQLVAGNPLAIELTATWVRVLTCEQIVEELQSGLDILSTNLRDVDERHHSMVMVCEQSWRLLSSDEQSTFMNLSVFQGAFSLEAARAVADASLPILSSLVDQSMLQLDECGCYQIHEVLRVYGLEQLHRSPEQEQVARDQHMKFYSDMLHNITPALNSSEQGQAISQIDQEITNILAAWKHAIERNLPEKIDRMMKPLAFYYEIPSMEHDGKVVFNAALEKFGDDQTVLSGKLWVWRGWFGYRIGDIETALNYSLRGFSILDAHGATGILAMPFSVLSWYEDHPRVDFEELQTRYETELQFYDERGDDWSAAWILYGLGNIARWQGDVMQSKQYLKDSIRRFGITGDGWSKTWALGGLCTTLRKMGHYEETLSLYEDARNYCEAVGDASGVSYALSSMGEVSQALGDHQAARQYFIGSLQSSLETRNEWTMIDASLRYAELLANDGALQQASEIFAILKTHPITQVGWARERRDSAAKWLGELQNHEVVVSHQNRNLRGVVASLIADAQGDRAQGAPNQEMLIEPLSDREIEVLQLVMQGLSNRQIAEELVLALGTVKAHIHNIFGKLGVRNRTEAAEKARQMGV